MRTLLFLFLLFVQFPLHCNGQKSAVSYVEDFAKHLHDWSVSLENSFKERAIKQCAGNRGEACVVSDSLMMVFERLKNRTPGEKYSLPNYLQGFHSLIYKGDGITIDISDIKEETDVVFDEESLDDDIRNKLSYVSCWVRVSGELNYSSHDLFCVRKHNGRISQIAPYVGVRQSPQSKVLPKVNTRSVSAWDEIADGEFNSIEIAVGYSKSYMLNASFGISEGYFNFGLEGGYQPLKKPFIDKPYKDYDNAQYKPTAYIMVSPGVFLRYVTISCGVGVSFMDIDFAKQYQENGVYVSESGNTYNGYFSLKPKVSLNLPLPLDFTADYQDYYLCPYVGYSMTPKLSGLNSWEFGIGLRFLII